MHVDTLASLPVFQLLGLCGACLYICNYVMLTFRVINAECFGYFVINFAAASLVLLSLTYEFNAASALIQSFWIAVSTYGLVTRLRPRSVRRNPERLRPLR